MPPVYVVNAFRKGKARTFQCFVTGGKGMSELPDEWSDIKVGDKRDFTFKHSRTNAIWTNTICVHIGSNEATALGVLYLLHLSEKETDAVIDKVIADMIKTYGTAQTIAEASTADDAKTKQINDLRAVLTNERARWEAEKLTILAQKEAAEQRAEDEKSERIKAEEQANQTHKAILAEKEAVVKRADAEKAGREEAEDRLRQAEQKLNQDHAAMKTDMEAIIKAKEEAERKAEFEQSEREKSEARAFRAQESFDAQLKEAVVTAQKEKTARESIDSREKQTQQELQKLKDQHATEMGIAATDRATWEKEKESFVTRLKEAENKAELEEGRRVKAEKLKDVSERAIRAEEALMEREIKIVDAAKELASALDRANRVETQRDEARAMNQQNIEEMYALQECIAKLASQLDAATTREANVEASLKEKSNLIGELVSQLDAATTREIDLEAALNDKEIKIFDLEEELACAIDRAYQAEKQKYDEPAEFETIIEEMNAMVIDGLQLKKEAEAESARLRKTNADLVAANQKLSATIHSLQSPTRSRLTPGLMENGKNTNNNVNSKRKVDEMEEGTLAIDPKKSKCAEEAKMRDEIDGHDNGEGKVMDRDFVELSQLSKWLQELVWSRLIKRGCYDLSSEHLARLDYAKSDIWDKWLNDELITGYLNLVKERNNADANLPRTHVFSTLFFSNFTKDGYSKVKRWTRAIDIFSFHILLFPIHVNDHWSLIIVNVNKRSIDYYDSMNYESSEEKKSEGEYIAKWILRYLEMEANDKKSQFNFDPQEWTIHVRNDIPLQDNEYDCGVFAVKYADYATRSERPVFPFNQSHIEYFRKRMLVQLIQNDLNAR